MNYLASKPSISSGERKKSRENGRASGEARIIFRVWLSSDFSRLPKWRACSQATCVLMWMVKRQGWKKKYAKDCKLMSFMFSMIGIAKFPMTL